MPPPLCRSLAIRFHRFMRRSRCCRLASSVAAVAIAIFTLCYACCRFMGTFSVHFVVLLLQFHSRRAWRAERERETENHWRTECTSVHAVTQRRTHTRTLKTQTNTILFSICFLNWFALSHSQYSRRNIIIIIIILSSLRFGFSSVGPSIELSFYVHCSGCDDHKNIQYTYTLRLLHRPQSDHRRAKYTCNHTRAHGNTIEWNVLTLVKLFGRPLRIGDASDSKQTKENNIGMVRFAYL